MTAFTFPQAGERVNSSAVPVLERILANLLISTACDQVGRPCDIPNCPACQAARDDWRRTYEVLAPAWQEWVRLWCTKYHAPRWWDAE